jgi:hypothetical protein
MVSVSARVPWLASSVCRLVRGVCSGRCRQYICIVRLQSGRRVRVVTCSRVTRQQPTACWMRLARVQCEKADIASRPVYAHNKCCDTSDDQIGFCFRATSCVAAAQGLRSTARCLLGAVAHPSVLFPVFRLAASTCLAHLRPPHPARSYWWAGRRHVVHAPPVILIVRLSFCVWASGTSYHQIHRPTHSGAHPMRVTYVAASPTQ